QRAQVHTDRAIGGTEVGVWYRGRMVGRPVRHDTRPLLAHLARLDPPTAPHPAAQATAERLAGRPAAYAGAPSADTEAVDAPARARAAAEPGDAAADGDFLPRTPSALSTPAPGCRGGDALPDPDSAGDLPGFPLCSILAAWPSALPLSTAAAPSR